MKILQRFIYFYIGLFFLLPALAWGKTSVLLGPVTLVGDFPRHYKRSIIQHFKRSVRQKYRVISQKQLLAKRPQIFTEHLENYSTEQCFKDHECTQKILSTLNTKRILSLKVLNDFGMKRLSITLTRNDEKILDEAICEDCNLSSLQAKIKQLVSRVEEKDQETQSDQNNSKDDHGNKRSTATFLSLGQKVTAQLEKKGDEDFFKVLLSQRGRLNITVDPDLDTLVDLQNSTGKILKRKNFISLRESFAEILEPGLYYIKVIAANYNDTGAYTLWVDQKRSPERFQKPPKKLRPPPKRKVQKKKSKPSSPWKRNSFGWTAGLGVVAHSFLEEDGARSEFSRGGTTVDKIDKASGFQLYADYALFRWLAPGMKMLTLTRKRTLTATTTDLLGDYEKIEQEISIVSFLATMTLHIPTSRSSTLGIKGGFGVATYTDTYTGTSASAFTESGSEIYSSTGTITQAEVFFDFGGHDFGVRVGIHAIQAEFLSITKTEGTTSLREEYFQTGTSYTFNANGVGAYLDFRWEF
ncbi:MAG: hypothetical protein ACI86H_001079 [bacterium]|jgi:hypothetical protein